MLSVGVDEVARTVRAELGAEIDELFNEFDNEAIAAASLAQVREAEAAVAAAATRQAGRWFRYFQIVKKERSLIEWILIPS